MRWIVGLLLVSAAILKAVQFVTEPSVALATGQLIPPLQVGAELAIGLVALSGFYWRQLRWIALLLFIGFAGYSFHLATSGATSCGCFGPLRVHPWWTFGLDVAVVSGLLLSIVGSPRTSEQYTHPGRDIEDTLAFQRTLIAAAMAISIVITALLVRHLAGPTAAADGLLQMAGDLIVLEPDKWLGKPLPIAEFIDLDLSTGAWTVLLHRHDCPDCQDAVPKYEQLALEGTKVALVEVPTFGDFQPSGTACHYGRLTEKREWFVQTPVEIILQNGVVSAVTSPDH